MFFVSTFRWLPADSSFGRWHTWPIVFCLVLIVLCATGRVEALNSSLKADWLVSQQLANGAFNYREEAAQLQNKLKQVGCMRRSRHDEAWGWNSSLDFQDFLTASGKSSTYSADLEFSKVLDLFNGMTAAKLSPLCAKLYQNRRMGSKTFCDMPSIGRQWLDSLDYRDGDKKLQLGTVLDQLGRGYGSFLRAVPEPDGSQPDWLKNHARITAVRRDIFFRINDLLRLRRELVSAWAMNTYDICAQCILAADFKLLGALASKSASGKTIEGRAAGGRPIKIELDAIRFETLKVAHDDIQQWAGRSTAFEEAQKLLLNVAANNGPEAEAYAAAFRDAETAKTAMLVKIEANLTKHSTLNGIAPAKFASERSRYCGSMDWNAE